jgi:mannose-6-phosphate isomerase-like protein (cupin superfamily)
VSDKVDLAAALAKIDAHWQPHVAAELNGQEVRLAKLLGEFAWHAHEREDELYLVLEGRLELRLRERTIELGPGQLFVVPRGVEHQPFAAEECSVLLFEPAATVNTGDADDARRIEPGELKRL